ncbi:drug resistance [Trichoderma cornu-damae]|uniref:Drug resistance n=1 Tax=Trichoderma cornu-damae TaxID=654480 RepID=A0A9P8QL28_9HYPO|nr:drug resistance [Trichoderma cornu-damae]
MATHSRLPDDNNNDLLVVSGIEGKEYLDHEHSRKLQPDLPGDDKSSVRGQRDEEENGGPDLQTPASSSRTATGDRRLSLELTPSTIPPPESLLFEIPFIFTLCLAQLLAQAGLGQCIAPLHIIGDSFGTSDAGQLSWMPAAYSLTVGTFILIAGRLGDLFGHKIIFVVGFAWYALWSLLAGVSVWSSSIIFFDICRAFQGMGPAFAVPSAVAIIGRTYPPGRRKSMIFSMFGATAPGGFVLGAVFSSLFAELVWWPWGYFVMAMVCAAVAAAGIMIIPATPGAASVRAQSRLWEVIDVPGAATGVAGLVLVNFAWNQGPLVGWTTPYVYVLLIVGLLFLGAFAWIEVHAAFPLLPTNLFSGSLGFVLACVAAGWSSFGIWLFYLWQILELIRGKSPLEASAEFTVAAISGACAAFATGLILGKLRPSLVMFLSMTAFNVGCILIATMPAHQIYWAQTFVSILVMPWGMDMSFPAATIILSEALPKEHQGLAASLVNTVINYSISIGLGIAGTVESQISPGTAEQELLKGYRSALYVGIGLSGLGVLVATLFIVDENRRHVQERRGGEK